MPLPNTTRTRRVFLLSPASTAGRRAAVLFNPDAGFDLARRLREHGAPIGEVFSFLSGLYFRGKLAYARRFAATPADVFVITSSRGLVEPDLIVDLEDLQELSGTPIDAAEPRYRRPLERDVRNLVEAGHEAVLLGSIASGKYVDIMLGAFGERLLFPAEFVGRGDMSRGGLMLRHVDLGAELTYIPVAGAVRHGARPPKLVPRPRTASR